MTELGPTPARGRVISAVSVRWAIAGRAAEALPLAREAVEIARAHGDRDAEVEALNNVSVARANGGDLLGALAASRACLELALECGSRDLPRLYGNLATVEYDTGNLDAVVRYRREGSRSPSALATSSAADWLGCELAIDHFDLGDWDEALHEARVLLGGRTSAARCTTSTRSCD